MLVIHRKNGVTIGVNRDFEFDENGEQVLKIYNGNNVSIKKIKKEDILKLVADGDEIYNSTTKYTL